MSKCSTCGPPNTNFPNSVPNSNNGTVATPTTPPSSSGCTPDVLQNNINSPNIETCTPFQLTDLPEVGLIQGFMDQQFNIGGANVNVYKLLGIYEQGLLQDVTGMGNSISGGDIPAFPSSNAFTKYISEWASLQTGNSVICSAYIGYDFGELKLQNQRLEYGVDASIRQDICMIQIKQGCNSNNQCTKVRVERSNDGQTWYGVAILDLPNNDQLNSFNFKRTVPSRYWRLRPVAFNGGAQDYWVVQALQLINYEQTQLNNIQDRVLLENRDRNYSKESVLIKGNYKPLDVQANASQFGFLQNANQYMIEVSFNQSVRLLGRPFVIGDIIQLPSETQYTPTLQPILKYLEVIDVAWSTNGYTPQWIPIMQRLLAVPALQSQETQDIFGQLTANVDPSGLMNIDDGNATNYQDISDITQTIVSKSQTEVQERGENDALIRELSAPLIEQLNSKGINGYELNRRRTLYGIDGLPPNGAPYTEGDSFPANPTEGVYHRLTYTNIATNIPPRLYRYSSKKGQWIYLETDLRYQFKDTKPYLQEFINTDDTTPYNPKKGI